MAVCFGYDARWGGGSVKVAGGFASLKFKMVENLKISGKKRIPKGTKVNKKHFCLVKALVYI